MISELYNEQMGEYFAKLAKTQTNISGTAINTAIGNFPPPQIIKTNADRIRAMSNEELAEFLYWGHCPSEEYFDNCPRYRDEVPDCHKCWREWLKEEAKDE